MLLMLSVRLAGTAYAVTQACLPTNILLQSLHTRRGLKWAIPVALILVPTYLFAAVLVTATIEDGGPGWLNLVVLTCIWNTIKFAWMGIASPVLWARAIASTEAPRGPVRLLGRDDGTGVVNSCASRRKVRSVRPQEPARVDGRNLATGLHAA